MRKQKCNRDFYMIPCLQHHCSTCCTIMFKNVALYPPLPHPYGWSVNTRQMSDSIRDTGFSIVVGMLLAILVIGGIAAAGFKIPALRFPSIGNAANEGTLQILVTDAPIRDLKHLNITIDSFEVHKNDTDEWISVEIKDGQASFDLLALKNGNITEEAAVGVIPAGNYTMIRMHVVEGLAFTNATLDDDSVIPLNVPSEKIKIPIHFEIEDGQTTTIILDITADSVKIASNPDHNFRPVVKPIVTPPKPQS